MSRRAYLYFALTFLLGVMAGAGGLFTFAWYGRLWHRPPPDPERIVRFLKRRLDLTDQQVGQLKPIVEDWTQKQKELRDKMDPQFQALRDDFRNRVRQILNPDQVAKFSELNRRFDDRMKKMRPQQGHP